MALGAVVVLAVAGLVAWRWWLAERRFEVTHKAAARDEALATFEPRIRAIEDELKSRQWAAATKR